MKTMDNVMGEMKALLSLKGGEVCT